MMSASWIALVVVLWLAVAQLAVIVVGLIHRVNQLESGVARDTPVPVARLSAGDHLPVVRGFEKLTATETLGTKRVILFLGSTCSPCRRLADEIESELDENRTPLPADVELILITDPNGPAHFPALGASDIVTQTASQITRAWGIPGTPFAVAVDELGTVSASGFAGTSSTLREIAQPLAAPILR